ncbi:hypothetical protein JCM11641_002571 [Rhodosporidiobolus odoratus]
MSDASFAALDAILQQEENAVASLSEENARLRALLEQRDLPTSTPSIQLDPSALFAELQATKAAQDELFRELKALRESQTAVASAAAEDHSDEVALLRGSLAALANELEAEKIRVTALETQRREEEEKVTTLRSKVEESRRALMRLQNESSKRSSVAEQGHPFPQRRSSRLDTAPRRRSSLGLALIPGSPASPTSPKEVTVGLGLAVSSPTSSTFSVESASSSTAKATPLARYAHRRGSASLSVLPPSNPEEDDRTSRLRELRLGVSTTKVHSRKNSAASGLPDFAAPFDWDIERRLQRRLSASTGRRNRNSICEEDESEESTSTGPPSANLRMLGRNNSIAQFEAWSRRSSSATTDSAGHEHYNPEPAMQEHLIDLQLQLQGLKIQLAESEEGRRASELCLKALKEFIAKSQPDSAPLPISLPPLPTEVAAEEETRPPVAASSRWSISRLSLSRRESVTTPHVDPSSSAFSRRLSTASSSAGTYAESKPTPSLPSFGSFSFAALVSRPTSVVIVDADTVSPTMPSSTLPSAEQFPTDPSPLLPSSGPSRRSRSSQDDAFSECDGESVAPSLISDLSSRASSRASSPEIDCGKESLRVDFAGEQDQLVEAARMPVSMGKSSLTTFVRAVGISAQ